jgi:hypothetical protein
VTSNWTCAQLHEDFSFSVPAVSQVRRVDEL